MQSPAHRGPEFIDQSIFPKKIDDSVYFQQQQKSAKLKRREGSRGPYILFSFAFLLLLKIYRIAIFFWKNWLVNEFRRGIARDIQKKLFSFSKRKKMVTKLGQFTKLGDFSFLNCPNFVTIFCQILKMEIIFFYIPSHPPPIAVRSSLTNQFFQNNWQFCIFSKKNKMQNWREEKGHFRFLNCPHFVTIVCQVLKMEIIFLISLAIPRPLRSGIHWPINFSKKNWCFCIFSNKKKDKFM